MTRTAPIRIVATEPDAATKAFRGERYAEFSPRDLGIEHIGGQPIRDAPVRFPPSVEPGIIYRLELLTTGAVVLLEDDPVAPGLLDAPRIIVNDDLTATLL